MAVGRKQTFGRFCLVAGRDRGLDTGRGRCCRCAAGEEELAEYAAASPYGLKLAAIVQFARKAEPVLFVHADILWFKDPAELLGAKQDWDNRAVSGRATVTSVGTWPSGIVHRS